MGEEEKNRNVKVGTKLENSNCDYTQKLKLWETQRLKLWQNSKNFCSDKTKN